MPVPLDQNNVTFVGGDNITLSQSRNSVSIMGADTRPVVENNAPGNLNTAGYAQNREEFVWNAAPNAASLTFGQTTSYIFPVTLGLPLSFNFVRLPVSFSIQNINTAIATTAVNVTASWATTWNFQIFTKGSGANSLSLRQYTSGSASMAQLFSVSMAGGGTRGSVWTISYLNSYPMSSTAQATYSAQSSASQSNVSVNSSNNSFFTGRRVLDIPFSTTIDPGVYWLAIGSSTASATQSAGLSVLSNMALNVGSFYAASATNAVSLGEQGVASNASVQFPIGLGSYTAAAGATTASIPFANISVKSDTPVPIVGLHRTA